MTLPDTIQIGKLTLKPLRRLLIKPDSEETLDPLVMKVLVCLVSKGGRVVTREEIVAEVWPDGFAGEQSLSRAIWALRTALGDDAKNPEFIETVPRIGYRFIPVVDQDMVHTNNNRESQVDASMKSQFGDLKIDTTAVLVRKVRRLQVTVGGLGVAVVCLLMLLLTARPDYENTEIIKVRNQDGTVDSVMVSNWGSGE